MSQPADDTPLHAAPQPAVELEPGMFSLGGMLPAERLGTWLSGQVRGWAPSQCFVLRDGDEMLMLDGGLPVVREGVRAGLAALTQGTRARRFCMTRRELDTILNLPWIVHEFGFTSVHCGGDLSPIDFFEAIDEASADAQITSLADAPFTFLRPGEIIELGRFRLEMLRASVMVLPTFWFYEATTRTLFCSDCWGLASQPEEGGAWVVGAAGADLSTEGIRAMLDTKFGWLAGIDNSPIARDLEALFADRPIDRLCPNFGCVIEGPGLGDTILRHTVEALEQMAEEPWQSALAGWRPGGGASLR